MRTTATALLLLAVASSASALTVTITAKTEGGDKPIVIGATNLPDGTDLLIELSRKKNSYIGQIKTTVSRGSFRAGPFSEGAAGLNPGAYALQITMPVAAVQPQSTVSVIGKDGSKLEGPLVRPSSFGGKFIQFKTTIKVGAGVAVPLADKASRLQSQADKRAWWLQSCKYTCNMSQTLAQRRNESFDFESCYNKCIADEPNKK